ncbi:hypothetical protein GCG21_07830 [Pseudactinotalea sp. HY160]|uniref:hypothetical protein n=1 Tax=Pseudactinotalea sp. HY160 TaxID=2654490 RepID=UPI00128D2D3A|nr:hypothetical protein [Pseudactinotalea sp. HY160]MPV49914.1 hypothetical protein [Pseudactinotalea sp. HY160]
MTMVRLGPWALVIAVVLLGGCSNSGTEQSTAVPAGWLKDADTSNVSAAQAEEISDRVATADEYHAAFARYRECLSAAGFELENVQFNHPVYEARVPNAAVEDGADSECYQAEFRYVDILWQNSDLVQEARDPSPAFRECLQERGIEPAENMNEILEQLREAGIEPPECLQ